MRQTAGLSQFGRQAAVISSDSSEKRFSQPFDQAQPQYRAQNIAPSQLIFEPQSVIGDRHPDTNSLNSYYGFRGDVFR